MLVMMGFGEKQEKTERGEQSLVGVRIVVVKRAGYAEKGSWGRVSPVRDESVRK